MTFEIFFHKAYCMLKPYLTWAINTLSPVKPGDPKEIPIIINNRNRLTTLRKLIAALEQRGYFNIIVLDNNSTYPPLLDYYQTAFRYELIHLGGNYGHLSLWKTGLIKRFRRRYFVYTDSDVVPIDNCPDDFMQQFLHLMDQSPLTEKVGFSLKIDDIPPYYIRRKEVIEWEKKFWLKRLPTNPSSYRAAIDTTFALYRPNYFNGFILHSPHIRTEYPYQALHLPWYTDSNNPDPEEQYYTEHVEKNSHWCK